MTSPGVETHCPYCAYQCGVLMGDPYGGDEHRVQGDPHFPVNNGQLCIKGWTAGSLLRHPARLASPLLRSPAGKLEPVDWETALDFLADRTTRTLAEVLDAVDAVRETGPRDVLVTSVLHDDLPADSLDLVAVSDAGAWALTTPLLPITPNGCGDVTAALYLAHLRTTGSPARALKLPSASVFSIVALVDPTALASLPALEPLIVASPAWGFACEPSSISARLMFRTQETSIRRTHTGIVRAASASRCTGSRSRRRLLWA